MSRSSRKIAILILFFFILSYTVFADIVRNYHWSLNAVGNLVAKGLANDYSYGQYYANPHSRFEMGIIVNKIIKKLEEIKSLPVEQASKLITPADLKVVGSLVKEYKNELTALETSIPKTEEMLASFQETLYYYGKTFYFMDIHALTINSNMSRPNAVNGYDFYNFRGFVNNSAKSYRADFGIEHILNAKYKFGIELSGYYKYDNDTLNSLFGVEAPIHGFIPPRGGIQWKALADSSVVGVPNYTLQFNRLWIENEPQKWVLLLGSFRPKNFNPLVYYGETSPYLYGPKALPLWGGNLSGKSGIFDYEAFIAFKAPSFNYWLFYPANARSNPTDQPANPYYMRFEGISFGTDGFKDFFKRIFSSLNSLSLNFNYFKVYDDLSLSNRNNYLTVIPYEWETGHRNPGGYGLGTQRTLVGPQRETVLGVDFNFKNIFKNIDFNGIFARSMYTPVVGTVNDVNGYAYTATADLNLNPIKLSLGYQYVNPKFSPYAFPTIYGTSSATNPLVQSYNIDQIFATYYYPSNQHGTTFSLEWKIPSFKKTILTLTRTDLRQVRSNFSEDLVENGFIDLLYSPILVSKGKLPAYKGTFSTSKIELSHVFSDKVVFETAITFKKFNRGSSLSNPMDADVTIYDHKLKNNLNKKLSLDLGFFTYTSKGRDVTTAFTDYQQSIPLISFNYAISDSSSFSTTFRWFSYADRNNSANDYNASHFVNELKLKF
ncbi:MAG: hypothetical protein HYU63_05180 [Armatimonadetes bacterium]|nr:hypothetical protein [Armatimonadota bacterium]